MLFFILWDSTLITRPFLIKTLLFLWRLQFVRLPPPNTIEFDRALIRIVLNLLGGGMKPNLKKLPAWIRQGLEKMEQEKMKKQMKEEESKKAAQAENDEQKSSGNRRRSRFVSNSYLGWAYLQPFI